MTWDGKQLRRFQQGGCTVCPGCGQRITRNKSGFCRKCEAEYGLNKPGVKLTHK